ncbi:MAG: hypothetical protein NT076_01180 [Candidatus Pacearchaeota archaeon]|nr:hypothetical protein [Candidatus Pacearchaeota archaeon]
MNLEEIGLIAQAIESMLLLEKRLEKSMDKKDAESLKNEKEELLKLQKEVSSLLENGN